jgi:hypothetical protein
LISLLRTFAEKQRLQRALRSLARADLPRIALVKQDCNEDLYCCLPDVDTLSLLRSTLLRSGPISLFASFAARYLMVTPDDAPECRIWREKADALGWAPADWFWNFRTRIPGRDHGQAAFSQPADAIDWSAFDIVISIDVAVPARITRRYPTVVWAYFVREVKAPSYQQSLQAPLAGQDLFLSQNFAPRRSSAAQHVIDFPYHFQRSGVFHQLAGLPWGAERRGVFVEYHSARERRYLRRRRTRAASEHGGTGFLRIDASQVPREVGRSQRVGDRQSGGRRRRLSGAQRSGSGCDRVPAYRSFFGAWF